MTSTQQKRQHWMSILAKANADQLISISDNLVSLEEFETIRAAEVGLTQVRGRMGGTGSKFNLGDMTITRCVLRSKQGHYGHSYVAGRNKDHATRAAQLDALLQQENQQDELIDTVIKPLEQALAEQAQQKAQEVAQTKVNFFTLVRGED